MEGVFELGVHLLLYPDIVLLDLDMKDMNGIETLKKIKAADLDSRVIVLTVSDSEEDVVSALCAGAEGYLLKDMEPEDLLENMKMLPKDTWSSATG
ncbi:MAG: response regulator [Acidiferrobacterales bacterium]